MVRILSPCLCRIKGTGLFSNHNNAMELPHPNRATAIFFFMALIALQSCTGEKKVYQSDCDADMTYKHVGFTQLIDSIQNYDQQYVEIDGTYKEGKGLSAIVNDSLFSDHSNIHALWVNFSQDCPLYQAGTHTGLFEYNNGKFTQLNNKQVTIRGKVDVKQKGSANSYKGCIDRVSYVKL
jgi:hypothetical protein